MQAGDGHGDMELEFQESGEETSCAVQCCVVLMLSYLDLTEIGSV